MNKIYETLKNAFKTYEQEQVGSKPISPDNFITDFLDHLVFSVNQPNEIELGKINGKEIGKEFNLIDSDLAYSKLYEYMLKWMKYLNKEKKAFFLSYDEGKKFFDETKQKITKLVPIGTSSLYRYEIQKFGITFNNTPEELQKFLTSCEKQVFNLVNPQETTFSAIQVDQALDICHNKGLYKENDSHIFANLKYLLTLEQFIKAFRSEKNNLLIIECKTTEEDTQELFKQLSKIIQSDNKKKFVFITQKMMLWLKNLKMISLVVNMKKWKMEGTTLMTLLLNLRQNS